MKIFDRIKYDLTSMLKLFYHAIPLKRLVLGKDVFITRYGFGDTSGSCFGASWEDQGGEKKFWKGTWVNNMAGNSLNLRELKNLTEALDILARGGRLTGIELFILTDKTTADAAYSNGTSFSSQLFDCVLRLRFLEMIHRCKIHIFCVSGDRMIEQRDDGLSSFFSSEGDTKGRVIFQFIPVNKNSLER